MTEMIDGFNMPGPPTPRPISIFQPTPMALQAHTKAIRPSASMPLANAYQRYPLPVSTENPKSAVDYSNEEFGLAMERLNRRIGKLFNSDCHTLKHYDSNEKHGCHPENNFGGTPPKAGPSAPSVTFDSREASDIIKELTKMNMDHLEGLKRLTPLSIQCECIIAQLNNHIRAYKQNQKNALKYKLLLKNMQVSVNLLANTIQSLESMIEEDKLNRAKIRYDQKSVEKWAAKNSSGVGFWIGGAGGQLRHYSYRDGKKDEPQRVRMRAAGWRGGDVACGE